MAARSVLVMLILALAAQLVHAASEQQQQFSAASAAALLYDSFNDGYIFQRTSYEEGVSTTKSK